MSSKTVIFPNNVSKERCLIELWKCTNALGFGAFHSHKAVSLEDARQHFRKSLYVDYFHGKPIKTYFTKYPILDPYLYDRDTPNGTGTMLKVKNILDGKKEDIKLVGATEKLNENKKLNIMSTQMLSIEVFDTNSQNSGNYHKIQNFDRVMLTDEWVKKAKSSKIPYPSDWFMVTGLKEQTYNMDGSMGGGFSCINMNTGGVIKHNLGK